MHHRTFSDVHKTRKSGEQLFSMLDEAWTRAAGERVGFALMTARNRSPVESGGDSPLNLLIRGNKAMPLLGRIGSHGAGPMKYRDNSVADNQELDVTIMRVRNAEQVPPAVLRHGARPIYAGAMRNYLINSPDAQTSYHHDGPAGEFAGELRVAGGLRVLGTDRGIVVINSRDQLQSHVAAAHWALMASEIIDRKVEAFPEGEATEIIEAMSDSIGAVLGEIGLTQQVAVALPHQDYEPLLDKATAILLTQGEM